MSAYTATWPGTTDLAIETTGLVKHFGTTKAVDGVDMAVPVGSIFGFLGPNGSGKTTTIRLLLGLMRPTSGEVRLLDQQMPARRLRVLPTVGTLIEGPAFYPFLTGRENLERFDAAESGPRTGRADRIDGALDQVGLCTAAAKRYRAYSLGMKQRLSLAAAVLRPRQLLVLDEPTNGLDPQGTREVRELIRSLASADTTIFLSSHLLAEVEALCTHAAILSRGRLLAQASLENLNASSRSTLNITVSDPAAAARVLETMAGVRPLAAANDRLSLELRGISPGQCNRALVFAGIEVKELVERRPSLEETFIALTGEGFDVGQ